MANSAPSPAPARAAARSKGGIFALRNWRVRSKLVVLVVLPTAAALILGGVSVASSVSSAIQYQRVSDTAELAGKLATFADQLQLERDLTAWWVAEGRQQGAVEKMQTQQGVVDKTKSELGPIVQRASDSDYVDAADIRQVRNRMDELAVARKAAAESLFDTGTVINLYEQIIRDLLAIHEQVSQGAVDTELSHSVATFGALSRAKAQMSRERALLLAGLAAGRFTEAQRSDFVTARSQRDSELNTFRSEAPLALRNTYDDTVSGQKIDQAEFMRARALFLTGRNRLLADRLLGGQQAEEQWFEAASTTVDRMRKVEIQIADSIMLRSRTLKESEQRSAIVVAALILALLVAVLIVTAVMARSLVRPLRTLRGEALEIAGQRLPETVRRLRESGDLAAAQVDPIGVVSEDEVGEVARAFDEVHREAVRLAGEEARLRANVNAMFVNLSRRSQTLVERQITLIDSLEQGEQDEQRLGNLFKLDHLATRMRRNSENLLVLAGQDPPRRWSQPVKLVDVARASLSEVENYERVALQVPDGASVAGQAVNDIIHLLAELVENALSFSPRETRVVVSASRIDGGAIMLSITDNGIGMTQEELAHANERLENSPTVDVSVSRRMGLFVVARLAHRHGVRVQLRPHGAGGLTAMVLLPESLLGAQPGLTGAAPGMPGAVPGPAHSSDPFASASPALAAPSMHAPIIPEQMPGSWPATPQYGEPPAREPQFGGPGFGGEQRWPSDPGPSWPADSPASAFPSAGSGFGTGGFTSDSAFSTGGTFDTADPWLASRGWNAPPAPPEEPPSWTFPPERTPERKSFDFPETESAATGPIPVVKPPSAGDEFLPIFASVESAWFEQGGTSSWGTTKADAGWNAAAAAREPVNDGSTSAGLPKRVPKANLVPGSADAAAKAAAPAPPPAPALPPERVRSRLSSFQQGFRAARADLSEGRAQPPGSRNVDSREEDE
ncbi:nitrate- and nitrite sensing domain-containing protein [Nonomuraea sp. NPDC050310]|uniref:sensor histidine kinase n=1 Tax=Nonomuraea sp. NPDC050310 TaxID=3154935 RepID=UPI0033D7E1C2